MAKIFNNILDNSQVEEIFNYSSYNNIFEAVCDYFDEVYTDGDFTDENMPKYHRYVTTTKEGLEIYYDYGADYYFAVQP
jgi:hypothetical protein